MITEQFNPAAEAFSYGEEVYNEKLEQAGVVMGTNGTLVYVSYYDKDSGEIQDSTTTSMQDLINNSSK